MMHCVRTISNVGLTVALLLIGWPAHAQMLAMTSQNRNAEPAKPATSRPLNDVLNGLRSYYRADILFEAKTVAGISVSSQSVNTQISLEENLANLLPALGLTYKKVNRTSYTISVDKAKRKETSTDARFQTGVAPDGDNTDRVNTPSLLSTDHSLIGTVFTVADRTISGVVNDESGTTLPGVSIVLKGTPRGTVTDADGKFRLDIPGGNGSAVLVFSFVGYLPQEVTVGSKNQLVVSLQVDTRALNEVVVVGYGTQKKRDLTGSVTSVDPTKLDAMPIQNVQQALQGQAAGVKVRQNSGEPGGQFSVFIRGANSASGDSQPLYVVDGVPLTSGSINTLNPDEIETIDILKDASASAIYGTRAANGVVLITTKLGKKNQPTRINVDGEIGIQRATRLPDMMNSVEQADLSKEAYIDGGTTIPANLNDPAFLAANNNNWYDLATRQGIYQKYNLSITGGSEKTQFLVGGSYQNTNGVVRFTNNLNTTLRINIDHQATAKLKIGARLTGGYNYGTDFQAGDLFGTPWRQVAFVRPFTPNKDADGNYLPGRAADIGLGQNQNPIFSLENANRYRTQYTGLGNVFAEYELLKGLKLRYSGGFEFFLNRLYNFDPIYDLGDNKNSIVNVNDNIATSTSWLSDITLNYDKTLGQHHLTLLAGTSAQKFSTRFSNVTGQGAANNSLNELTGQTTYNVAGGISPNGLYSYFGRVFYTFKDRYLLTATVRRDGSSRFGPESRWGTFPSASVGWVVSDESFMKPAAGWLSQFKIRASYGLTGNQNIPNFRFLNLTDVANYANGNAIAPGFATLNPSNPAIRWESLKQTDIGFDLGLLNNRIQLVADYYVKQSEGLLTNVQLSPSTGYTGTYTKNVGNVENKGWEFGLNTVNTTGMIKWTTSFNVAFNRNKVLDLGLDNLGNSIRLQGFFIPAPVASIANVTTAGQPLSSFYGLIFDGIYQSNETAEAAARGIKPGDVRYKDLNGDGQITEADKTFIGNPNPKYYGGITNTVSYKGVSLSVFLDYAGGYDIINGQRFFQEGGTAQLWASRVMLDRWTPTNPSATVPRALRSGGVNNRVSTRYIEKGDFVRLNTISITYNLPRAWLKSSHLYAAKVSLTGNNLHFWTNYSGYNPEANTRDDALSQGIDFGSYPLARTYLARLSLTF